MDYKYFDDTYKEPIYNSRFESSFSTDYSVLGEAISDDSGPTFNEGSRVQEVCWDNVEVDHCIKGNSNQGGEDYATWDTRSHKIYLPETESPYYYNIALYGKYSCRYWEVQTSGDQNTVIRTFIEIEGYNGLNNIISTSSSRYIANYDSTNGVDGNDFAPTYIDDDIVNDHLVEPSDWHSIGSSITLMITENIEYVKIRIVTIGSWLYSTDGIHIKYSNFQLTYDFFSGCDITKGDYSVSATKSYSQDNVVLTLQGGSNYKTDYGTIKTFSSYLYYNNGESSFGYPGRFKIDYQAFSWTRQDRLIFRGYFKIHYYDKNLLHLGTDSNQFIDVDTVNTPNKLIEPSTTETTIYINPESIYNAKYVRCELMLTGSYLMSNDGGSICFNDLGIATAASDSCIEIGYYYQSDYGSDDDRTTNYWYYMNYYFNEKLDNRLCILENQIDDDVTIYDFSGSSSDDVSSYDFFFYDGHGSQLTSETAFALTNNDYIDDDEICNWGPELEFGFLKACHILGFDQNSNNQIYEWGDKGLYKAHGLLGFKDITYYVMSNFHTFLRYIIVDGYKLSVAFSMAFGEEEWISIWDTSDQRDNDYFWDISFSPVNSVRSDESSNDGNFYVLEA